MEKETTITPIEETPIEETPNEEEVNQGESKKEFPDIPYARFAEVVHRKQELEDQIIAQTPIIEAYSNYVELLKQNPKLEKEIQQLCNNYFSTEEEEKNEEENEDNFGDKFTRQLEDRLKQIEDRQFIFTKKQIEQTLEKEMAEVMTRIKKNNFSISERDIYQIMLNEEIGSPLKALNYLIGDQIDTFRKQWEVDYTTKMKNIPSGTPSVGGIRGNLQVKRPKDFEEAVAMALKEGKKYIIEK